MSAGAVATRESSGATATDARNSRRVMLCDGSGEGAGNRPSLASAMSFTFRSSLDTEASILPTG
jgi:hypothetical protein